MNFLNKLPVWVYIVAGILVGYLFYRWYKARKKSTAANSLATASADNFTTGLSFLLAGGKG